MVVIGAGPIGLMLVRLARLRGARVVAVGRNRGRLESALALGAAEAIDATSVSARRTKVMTRSSNRAAVVAATPCSGDCTRREECRQS